MHNFVTGDCLYRFKNHATWILPSLDIDEYINMKDGSVFEGGKVPEDYLGSSWDAIVKKRGLQPNTVRSMEFNIYRFALVQPGRVELSSVLREPRKQPTCPKFVVNPNLVDTVFVHWATSWKNGTQNLHLGTDTLVVHHYLQPANYALAKRIEANATDDSMQQYVPGLSTSLATRFHQETTSFLSRLSSVGEVPMKPSTLYNVDGLDTEEELQVAQDPSTAAWIKFVSNLKGIAIVDPPSEHGLH